MLRLTRLQAVFEYNLAPPALEKERPEPSVVELIPRTNSKDWVRRVAESNDRDLLSPWEQQRADSGRVIERSPGIVGFTGW